MKFENIDGVSKRSSYTIHISKVRFAPEDDVRVRTTDRYSEFFEQLVQSIAQHGIEQDVTGYRGKDDGEDVVFLTDGRTRYQAMQECLERGLLTDTQAIIPVKLEDQRANELDHLFRQFRANHSLQFEPVEQGELFKRAMKLGASEDDLVTETGLSLVQIKARLELGYAMPEIKQMVKSGEVSPTTAIQTIKEFRDESGSQAEAVEILKDAVEIAKSEGKGKASNSHVSKAKKEKAKPQNDVSTPAASSQTDDGDKEALVEEFRELAAMNIVTDNLSSEDLKKLIKMIKKLSGNL